MFLCKTLSGTMKYKEHISTQSVNDEVIIFLERWAQWPETKCTYEFVSEDIFHIYSNIFLEFISNKFLWKGNCINIITAGRHIPTTKLVQICISSRQYPRDYRDEIRRLVFAIYSRRGHAPLKNYPDISHFYNRCNSNRAHLFVWKQEGSGRSGSSYFKADGKYLNASLSGRKCNFLVSADCCCNNNELKLNCDLAEVNI